MKMSFFNLIFISSVTGILLAAGLILFHFEHIQITGSSNLIFDVNLNLKCKLIAKSLFALHIYHPFLSTLFYFESYRTLRSLKARKDCNKQYSVVHIVFISVVIGIIQKGGLGDTPSPLCMVSLSTLGMSCVLVVQSLFCLVMIIMMRCCWTSWWFQQLYRTVYMPNMLNKF